MKKNIRIEIEESELEILNNIKKENNLNNQSEAFSFCLKEFTQNSKRESEEIKLLKKIRNGNLLLLDMLSNYLIWNHNDENDSTSYVLEDRPAFQKATERLEKRRNVINYRRANGTSLDRFNLL